MEELTDDEKKMVRTAVKGALDLREGYVNIPYNEDAKMKRKKARMNKVEIPLLKSALVKLKS